MMVLYRWRYFNSTDTLCTLPYMHIAPMYAHCRHMTYNVKLGYDDYKCTSTFIDLYPGPGGWREMSSVYWCQRCLI